MQVFVKLSHHLTRLEAPAVSRQAFDPASHHAHQAEVFFDHLEHARAQHFDGNVAVAALAVFENPKMHLRN